jgi:hypothetical protein
MSTVSFAKELAAHGIKLKPASRTDSRALISILKHYESGKFYV